MGKLRFVGSAGLLAAAALSLILSACRTSQDQDRSGSEQEARQVALPKTGQDAVIDNRSRIEATVVEVQPLKAPRFRLRLRVDKVDTVAGYPSLATAGEEIDVYPNLVRREGQAIDPGSEENRHMLAARELNPGDKITAVVYRRGQGPNGAWLLMEWQRR